MLRKRPAWLVTRRARRNVMKRTKMAAATEKESAAVALA